MKDNKILPLKQAIEIVQNIEQRKEEEQQEFKKRLDDAHEEVMDRIYNCEAPFNYGDIEEIMYGHGLEMDYIEDWLI